MLYHKSFGFAGLGEPILYNGSTDYLLIALNQGHFTDTYGIEAELFTDLQNAVIIELPKMPEEDDGSRA